MKTYHWYENKKMESGTKPLSILYAKKLKTNSNM